MLSREQLRRRVAEKAAANNARKRAAYASPAAVAKRKANANAANKQRRYTRWVQLVQAVKTDNRRGFVNLFSAYKSNFPVYTNPTNAWYSINRALKLNANAAKVRANANAAAKAAAAKRKANANAAALQSRALAESGFISAGLYSTFEQLKSAVRNKRGNNFARIYNGSKSAFLAHGWPRQAVYNLAEQRIKNIPRLQPLPPRSIPPLQPLPPRPVSLRTRPPYLTGGKSFGYNFIPGTKGTKHESFYKLKRVGNNAWIPVGNGRSYSFEEVSRLPNVFLSNEELLQRGLRTKYWLNRR
jgi:hypothetical protein